MEMSNTPAAPGDNPKEMDVAFSYSRDESRFHGSFDTREEAVAEALDGYEEGWVGENEPPPQPEYLWDAEDWLEHVSCQDEYGSDAAEGWDDSTKEQRAELEIEVRKVMAAWLDKYDLRPKFWTVVNTERVTAPA